MSTLTSEDLFFIVDELHDLIEVEAWLLVDEVTNKIGFSRTQEEQDEAVAECESRVVRLCKVSEKLNALANEVQIEELSN